MIKGVISDMDGVILDSEKLYVRFWCEAGNFYGYPMQREHALGIRSMARPYAIEKLQGWFGEGFDYDLVRNKRVELMDAYVGEHGIDAKPGARELLSCLKEQGFRVALATATAKDRAEAYLDRLDLLKYFDGVASARMVAHGKPEPDIYLYAAEQLGLSPQECLALEDSPNGVRSAHAAGCKTILVPDLDDPSGQLEGLLDGVADGLLDVIRFLT
jgi:HAD superfamily hydrolase (TIGR01509 family)